MLGDGFPPQKSTSCFCVLLLGNTSFCQQDRVFLLTCSCLYLLSHCRNIGVRPTRLQCEITLFPNISTMTGHGRFFRNTFKVFVKKKKKDRAI